MVDGGGGREDERPERIVPLGAPGFEAMGAGPSVTPTLDDDGPDPSDAPIRRRSGRRPVDAPGRGWWRRRRCRRAGMGVVALGLFAVIIGLQAGVDGAKAVLGGPAEGGRLHAEAYCGVTFFYGMSSPFGRPEMPNTCPGGTLTVATLDGRVLATRPLTQDGASVRLDPVPASTVRVTVNTSAGAWERKAFVPHGSSVEVRLHVSDPYGDVDPQAAAGWSGRSPWMHALGLPAALLAAFGVVGGAHAVAMTRYRRALGGTAALSLAWFLLAAVNPVLALFGFAVAVDLLLVSMAEQEFRTKPTFEGTVLLD